MQTITQKIKIQLVSQDFDRSLSFLNSVLFEVTVPYSCLKILVLEFYNIVKYVHSQKGPDETSQNSTQF